ncbi:MAG: hypothetical protein M1165_02850 [Candidatus Pacearchaeota archaeon]|nr:hypothetical protein [Candidatus Pacearchaeota archaeon]MDE1848894.1 hypothetical protein [Nanoarchaeota archaeon]
MNLKQFAVTLELNRLKLKKEKIGEKVKQKLIPLSFIPKKILDIQLPESVEALTVYPDPLYQIVLENYHPYILNEQQISDMKSDIYTLNEYLNGVSPDILFGPADDPYFISHAQPHLERLLRHSFGFGKKIALYLKEKLEEAVERGELTPAQLFDFREKGLGYLPDKNKFSEYLHRRE